MLVRAAAPSLIVATAVPAALVTAPAFVAAPAVVAAAAPRMAAVAGPPAHHRTPLLQRLTTLRHSCCMVRSRTTSSQPQASTSRSGWCAGQGAPAAEKPLNPSGHAHDKSTHVCTYVHTQAPPKTGGARSARVLVGLHPGAAAAVLVVPLGRVPALVPAVAALRPADQCIEAQACVCMSIRSWTPWERFHSP
jgi:hypothetical protein